MHRKLATLMLGFVLTVSLAGADDSKVTDQRSPDEKACASRIAKAAHIQLKPWDDQFQEIAGICAEAPVPEMQSCVGRKMRLDAMLTARPFSARSFCVEGGEEAERCYLQRRMKVEPKFRARLLSVCAQSEYIGIRECVVDTIRPPEQMSTRDAGIYCKVPEGKGRGCVLGRIHQGLGIQDAVSVCRLRSSDTRECLAAFFLRQAPFNTGLVTDEHDANVICRISNRATRGCMFKALDGTVDTAEQALKLCQMANQETSVCESILETQFAMPNSADRRLVCSLPNFEIRACVIEKLTNGVATTSGISERLFGRPAAASYVVACDAEFATNLTNFLDAPAHGFGCSFTF